MNPTNVSYLNLDGKPKPEPNWREKALQFNPLTERDKQIIWENRYNNPSQIWRQLDRRHDQERIEFLIGDMEAKFKEVNGREPGKAD